MKKMTKQTLGIMADRADYLSLLARKAKAGEFDLNQGELKGLVSALQSDLMTIQYLESKED